MRSFESRYISHESTHRFTPIILDYLRSAPELASFQAFRPDWDGLDAALEARRAFPVDRQRLVGALRRQYAELDLSHQPEPDLDSLADPQCFTICTAHQPNLFTGYLYFIYKIIHCLRLAEAVQQRHPGVKVRPVFYMGTEDNDLEELGQFWYRGQQYTWDAGGHQGAVGRMETRGIAELWKSLEPRLGPPGPWLDQLQGWVGRSYLSHPRVGRALRQWLHELFGGQGLILLDGDDPELKAGFVPVMEKEMSEGSSEPLVRKSMEKLSERYRPPVHPRPINLFYLEEQLRDRIRKEGDEWWAPAAGKRWKEADWREEMEAHPERFSPNVILRALYQETLLPNIAFIGGGAELAYWMQVKTVFDYHRVFFPALILRQSISWIGPRQSRLRKKLGLSLEQLFQPRAQLIREWVEEKAEVRTRFPEALAPWEDWATEVEQKARLLDPGLVRALKASLARMENERERMEKKLYRARRRTVADGVRRLELLLDDVLPGGGLDERRRNFMEYYLDYGPRFFDLVREGIRPLGDAFLVIEDQGDLSEDTP